MPIILAAWEAEISRIPVPGQLWTKLHKTSSWMWWPVSIIRAKADSIKQDDFDPCCPGQKERL
jgi:hypothetical protein